MSDRWYSEAVVYCLDIDTYPDSNGDGIGDIQGLIRRLDYLARLGITTWPGSVSRRAGGDLELRPEGRRLVLPPFLPCPPGVLAHRAYGPTGVMLFLHNLGDRPATVGLGCLSGEAEQPNDVLADHPYGPVTDLSALRLAPYGYRWIRLHRTS